MAFNITEAVSQEDVANYFIEKLDTALVARYAMRYHVAGMGVDSFKIPSFDDVATGEYDGNDITVVDQGMSSAILLLDQKPYFAVQTDKVDSYENAVSIVTGSLDRGAYAIQKTIDAHVFNTIASTPTVPSLPDYTVSVDTVIKEILALGLKLSENDVPEFGRVLFVPPFFATALAEANIQLNTGSAEEATRRGWVGIFGGFEIYQTNNLANGEPADSKIIVAGVPNGGDFAQSLQSIEVISRELSFKDLVKGLSSNGAVVSNPLCYATVEVIPE